MYIPNEKHLKVFQEVHRVLRDDGRFAMWDAKIPVKHGDYSVFLVDLTIRLPNQGIETKYGVKWNRQQDIKYFEKLAQETGFRIISEWSMEEVFFLEMMKSV